MVTVPLPELDELARSLAGPRFDDYSARALGRAYEEFVARRRRAIAEVTIAIGPRTFESFYELVADSTANGTDTEIRLGGAPTAANAWEFLVPFERIALHSDGSADLYPPGGAPSRRAIARVLLREHFLPRTRAEEDRAAAGGERIQLPGLLGTLQQGIALSRSLALLPFAVAVEMYLPESRTRFEFDLVHMTLLADPRSGRLAASRRIARPSRVAWGVDRKIGRGDLSMLASRCLETLVESNGLSSVELAHVFGGVRELVDSAVQGLVQQRLVTFDRRTGIYRARIEAFLPSENAPEPDEPAYSADPSLRTSVQELLAAADARAACPLCGKKLPANHPAILCDECAAKVESG